MNALTSSTLGHLHPEVAVPRYDRTSVTTGIVHLSAGSFHRAHEAMYLDRLMNIGLALDWGICAVGLRPSNAGMRDVMTAQDCLYTLIVKHADGAWQPRVIGSIVEYMFAPDDVDAVIEKMAAPQIRIVSLTVTEGGYNLDPATGEFDHSNADVLADLAQPTTPTTTFGLVVEALARRRQRCVAPFTVLSCDNIQNNGRVSSEAFTTFARLRDPALGDWIAENVAFPNSMVDRITPRTTAEDRAGLVDRFDLTDQWPVPCEEFTQWVLQDHFSNGRPPLHDAGVQLVSDVEPYELMKLRLLNASHQALGCSSYLAGYRFVHEACADHIFATFLLDYMTIEAIPTLRPVPGIDLDRYSHQLVDRFSNPEIADTIARLCTNTSELIPTFLLPVLRAQLAAGGPIARATAVIACWARYAEGIDEAGHPITVVDDRAARLHAAARRQHEKPLAFLQDNRDIFRELVDDRRFTQLFAQLLDSLHEFCTRATLADLDRLLLQPG